MVDCSDAVPDVADGVRDCQSFPFGQGFTGHGFSVDGFQDRAACKEFLEFLVFFRDVFFSGGDDWGFMVWYVAG